MEFLEHVLIDTVTVGNVLMFVAGYAISMIITKLYDYYKAINTLFKIKFDINIINP